MSFLRDTFRDMTPDEMRIASRDEVVESGWFGRGSLPEIPRPGSIARTMLDAWLKGKCRG